MDAVNTTAWEGRTATESGALTEQTAAMLHLTLGGDHGSIPAQGETAMPLAHWCAFPPRATNADIGADGHPRLGDILPPLGLARRMWAGGSLSFHAPLLVGDTLTRSTTVVRIDDKGRPDAPLVFVTLQHDIYSPRGLSVRERQTLAYMNIPDSFVPPKPRVLPDTPNVTARETITETTLFRFSAVTFNAHRIHYDRTYATETEHYPDLVIHGPLQAMMLMRMACAHKQRPPSLFEFRGVHPLFVNAGPMALMGADQSDGSLSLFTGQNGHQGTAANAIWEETQ